MQINAHAAGILHPSDIFRSKLLHFHPLVLYYWVNSGHKKRNLKAATNLTKKIPCLFLDMEAAMEPGDRVKIIRKEANLTQEKFGKRLGVSKVAVSKIENKVNSLSDQMRRSICREFRINEEWLLSGTGEMHILPETDFITSISTEYGLDALETTILLEYVKLTPQSKQMFKAYLKSISERLNNENLHPKDDTLPK